MIVLETNCKVSMWELLALPVVRSCNVVHEVLSPWCCVTQPQVWLKVVTELGQGSKVDTSWGTGRSKIVPVIKNSKHCLSTWIVLFVSIQRRQNRPKWRNKLTPPTMSPGCSLSISSRRGEVSLICLEGKELVSHALGLGKGLSCPTLKGPYILVGLAGVEGGSAWGGVYRLEK